MHTAHAPATHEEKDRRSSESPALIEQKHGRKSTDERALGGAGPARAAAAGGFTAVIHSVGHLFIGVAS